VDSFLQGVAEGFDGTIHIAFDDEVEFFKVAQGETAADLIEGDMFLGADTCSRRIWARLLATSLASLSSS